MKLIELPRSGNQSNIFVNPDQIRYVSQSGNVVRLHFDDDQTVSVAGAIEQVVGALRED